MHPKVLIFVSRKVQCEQLAGDLRQQGYLVASLHSGRQQSDRSAAISAFREGSLRVLVATDVAARGLDVEDVEVVVNYDFSGGNKPGHPDCLQSYVHRIGRTARGGKAGVAYSLFINADKNNAEGLIGLLNEAGQPVPEQLQIIKDKWDQEKVRRNIR